MRPDRSDKDRAGPNESGVSKSASGAHRLENVSLPSTGDTIGDKYSILGILGSGAMGVVYEAMHTRLRQRLAIKVLRPDIGDFDKLLARFEREANASAQLKSIHAARVIDVDSLPNGLPYMVMELLEGRTLDAELTATGPMNVELAVDIVTQVATAMTEAHGLGIIHRDLKPANVFVCRVGDRPVIKVLDFGISKVEGDARLTGGGEWLGTPNYVPPEQLKSGSNGDARSDVWSLGVILFELLTGRTPFEGGIVEVIAKVLVEPIPRPTEFRPDLSRDLTRIVMRALQRDPGQRFQSMKEMAEALAPFGPSRSASTVVSELQRARGKLGEILVKAGLLTEADLNLALEEQRVGGKMLGKVLVEMGYVAHADLLTVLAKQQGLPAPANASIVEHEKRAREAPTLPPGTDPHGTVPTTSGTARPSLKTIALVALGVLLAAAAFGVAHRAAPPTVTPPASDTPR